MRPNLLFVSLLALAPAWCAESPLVIPHIADGGGWRTTVAVFNPYGLDDARVTIKFRRGDGALLAVPILNYGLVSLLELELAPNQSVYLETTGGMPEARTGWVEINQLTGSVPVRAFAVFRQTVAGRPDYEAVSYGMRSAASMTFPFDNTAGVVTSFAVVNLAGSACSVGVSPMYEESGRLLASEPRTAAGLMVSGHAAFVSTERIPELAGKRGFLKFYPLYGCGNGGIAAVGLRFNQSGPFTNIQPLAAVSPF